MAKIKELITGKLPGKKFDQSVVRTEILASAMAWQILFDYPTRKSSNEWLIYRFLRGVMLSDEVGGGKTFEALSIISKELLRRKNQKFRVLIIANPSIRSKWEWNENAHRKTEVTFSEFEKIHYKTKCDLAKFIKQTKLSSKLKEQLFEFYSNSSIILPNESGLSNKKAQSLWLSSFQSLPGTTGSRHNTVLNKSPNKYPFPKNYFDIIIVDEAHSLKSGSMDVDETLNLSGAAIRKIFGVLNANPKAKLILLTATPFQNNVSEFKHLLGLLENKKLAEKNGQVAITDLIAEGIDQLQKEFDAIKYGELNSESIKELKHKIDNDITLLVLKEKYHLQRPKIRNNSNQNGLDDYIRDIMIRNTKTPLKVNHVEIKLNENASLQYLLYRDLVKPLKDEKSQMFSTKLSQLVSSEESFKNNRIDEVRYQIITDLYDKNLLFELKFNKLLKLIRGIHKSKKKVITVFVSWLKTLEILRTKFDENKDEFIIKYLSSGIDVKDRAKKLKEISRENAKTDKKIILLVSRVGNEGLDFDGFSNHVIHYDNNFNPAIIDQRNGRVYRDSNILTKNGKVGPSNIKIFQLFLEATYDQRIQWIEQSKRKLKDFYLGDSGLDKIFHNAIYKCSLKERKEIDKILREIKIDLTPQKRNLLPNMKSEV